MPKNVTPWVGSTKNTSSWVGVGKNSSSWSNETATQVPYLYDDASKPYDDANRYYDYLNITANQSNAKNNTNWSNT